MLVYVTVTREVKYIAFEAILLDDCGDEMLWP